MFCFRRRTAGGGATTSRFWSESMSSSTSMAISFELVLTDDLPNGPYGEVGAMGLGAKIYVYPYATYNDVAGTLIKTWEKSRGDMMSMQMNHMTALGNERTMATYKEDWRVVSIDYKGGDVDQRDSSVAGTHNTKLAITQTVAPAAVSCCVIV